MPATSASFVGLIRLSAIAALIAFAAILGVPPSEPAGAGPVPSGPPENGVLIGSHDFDEDGTDDDVYAVPDGNIADPLPRVEIISGADDSQVAVITGDAVGDRFGAAVDMLWDIDEDGDRDLVIGAPGDAPLGAPASNSGEAFIFHGPFHAPGGTAYFTTADAAVVVAQQSDLYIHFGMQVAGTGDLTGDSINEIGVRARIFLDVDPVEYETYIFDGDTGALITTLTDDDDALFWSISGGPRSTPDGLPPCDGDVNADPDGYVDLADLLTVLANWGSCTNCPPACLGDTDADCIVGLSDLLTVLSAWGPCDAEGDGLPDAWELLYGLDLFTDDASFDADMDGLSNIEEFHLGTNPISRDSDGDGVEDGAEVNAGADPNNSADGGVSNDPDQLIWVTITIGDHGNATCGTSSHFSDLWALRIGSAVYMASPGDISNPAMTFTCPNGNTSEPERAYRGVWTSSPIPLVRDQLYEITVEHMGTDWPNGIPDYDYTAHVTPVASPTTGDIVCHHLSDPEGLLGQHWDQEAGGNPAAGKVATIGPPRTDIQVDFDNDGDIDDDDDECDLQVVRAGKLVALNDDDDDQNLVQDWNDTQIAVGEDDLVPMRLTVADLPPDATGTRSLTYTSERINILRSNTGNRDVIPSGVGQPLPIPQHVYVEAIALSEQKGDVFITFDTSDILGGDPECAEDIVCLTCIDVSFVGRDFSIEINSDGWADSGPGDDAAIEIPVDEALNISNYVPGEGRGVNDLYNNVGVNPDLFRIQVDNAARTQTPKVDIHVITPDPDDSEQVLGNVAVSKQRTRDNTSFRSGKIELVSDTVDDGAGTAQIRASLGSLIEVHHRPTFRDINNDAREAQPIVRRIWVGRPSSENNNDPDNQRKHDVRVLTVRTHVFQEPSGALSEQLVDVQQDVQVLRERMAQSTIRVAWDAQLVTHPLPDELEDGLIVRQEHADPFTDSEQAIVDLNPADNVVDVFYVRGITHTDALGDVTKPHGVAYTKGTNPTTISAGHNFFVINTLLGSDGEQRGPFTVAHEMMHILLDAEHRLAGIQPPPWDPPTALFFVPGSGSNTDDATKRIGPNWQTDPGGDPTGPYAGADDTTTIRSVAEILP